MNYVNTKLGCSENLFEGNQGKHGIKKKKKKISVAMTKGNFSLTVAFFLLSSKATQIFIFCIWWTSSMQGLSSSLTDLAMIL